MRYPIDKSITITGYVPSSSTLLKIDVHISRLDG